METVWDLLRKLVDDHGWRQESEKVAAHGVINRADPNYRPPVNPQVQNQTPEQLYIAQLEQQLAAARGQQHLPQNAAQQMQATYQPQPASAAAANPQEMRGYSYPVPGQQVQQPVAPTPQANPQQMTQYAYPVPQPETGYQPVANPFAQQ